MMLDCWAAWYVNSAENERQVCDGAAYQSLRHGPQLVHHHARNADCVGARHTFYERGERCRVMTRSR